MKKIGISRKLAYEMICTIEYAIDGDVDNAADKQMARKLFRAYPTLKVDKKHTWNWCKPVRKKKVA